MKTLQNNFTTPEQSKRLLELGVPADISDCYLTRFGIDEDWEIKVLNHIKYSEIAISNQEYCLPCWSVGRLIEIYITCIEHYTGDERLTFGQDTVRLGMIDCVIAAIEVGCDDGDMDFSKLEE